MSIIFDKKYQTMPDMPPAQFEALKQDIQERGLLTPIDIDEEGHILDGHHRYQALVGLGMTEFPSIVRPGMSEGEKRLFSRKTNMMRRHLGAKQIRELIRAQLRETPHWANNRIAQELGVDSKTVKTQRRHLESTLEIPKLTELEGADGKVRKKRSAGIVAMNASEMDRVIELLKKGGAKDLDSFLTATDAVKIHDSSYDLWAGLNKEQENEWHVFVYYLWKEMGGYSLDGAAMHVSWVRGKSFVTPSEWLGPVGTKWMRTFRNMGTDEECEKRLKLWEQYLSDNRGRVDELIREMEAVPKTW